MGAAPHCLDEAHRHRGGVLLPELAEFRHVDAALLLRHLEGGLRRWDAWLQSLPPCAVLR